MKPKYLSGEQVLGAFKAALQQEVSEVSIWQKIADHLIGNTCANCGILPATHSHYSRDKCLTDRGLEICEGSERWCDECCDNENKMRGCGKSHEVA